MKEIEILIELDGTTKIEPRGYSGGECKQITKSIEDSLGEVTDVEYKPEFYAQVSNQNEVNNSW